MADEELKQEYAEGEYYEESYEGHGDGIEQYDEHGVVYDAEGDNKHGEEEYGTFTEFYSTLQGQGVSERLAAKIDYLVQSEVITPEELDDRAVDGLKEFTEEDAIQVIDQFAKSDLSHVQNKSAFLCGVMKTYRTKTKQKEKTGVENNQGRSGPNEDKVKELLDRTGYSLDITTGQRKYGGPPPGWEGPAPGQGEKKFCSQIFVGKLPRDMYEDELIPMFEGFGQIYDFRLMIDPVSGLNKGYGFCTYATKEAAQKAVKEMDKKEVRGGKKLGICLSLPNDRLFVGSIPKSKTKQQIMDEFSNVTEGLIDVIVYISPEDKKENRGFAFLQYESHKAASLARRRLMSGKIRVFGNITPTVDWADPQEEPDDEIMQTVKVVYVRNLTPSSDEDKLNELFKQYGEIEKVKKIKDYAFIHFKDRENALRAIEELNGQEIDEQTIEVALAKPQSDKKERRRGMSGFGALNAGKNPTPRVSRGGPRGGMRGSPARGGMRGPPRYDDWGYESYGGYDQSYGGWDQSGYGDGYGQGYNDSYYDDYYGADQSYDMYYDSGSRGGRGGMTGGRGSLLRGGSGGGRGAGQRGGAGRGGYRGSAGAGAPRGVQRGGRGAGGRGGPSAGRGGPSGAGFKRKMDSSQQPQPKRQYGGDQGGGWNPQPIAQKPLSQSDGGNYYGYGGGSSGQEWYQDSYGQQWK